MNEESTVLRINQVYNMDIGKISAKCFEPHIIERLPKTEY